MKRIALTSVMALAASPVLAHGGAHLHPHGIEGLWVLGLVLIAVALLVWRR